MEDLDYWYYFGSRKDLDIKTIVKRSRSFASFIENNLGGIISILTKYETHEVAYDEVSRTLDLLTNLEENANYFKKEIRTVVSFLPRNQPLYALSCFAIVPSLMAEKVYVRPPTIVQDMFRELCTALKIHDFFSNIEISFEEREHFLAYHVKNFKNQETLIHRPLTDVVIFTGTSSAAEKIRERFPKETLVIVNGAGHNPIVITGKANIEKAVESAMSVQLYNQGQDCASPSSILISREVYDPFIELLLKKIKNVHYGPTCDKNNTVGPITDIAELERIQKIFIKNASFLHDETPGKIITKNCLVEPTIIVKPLVFGGNYSEQFSPIFFIQVYERDEDLSLYFETPEYAENAMYVTLFGESQYIESLTDRFIMNKILHDPRSIIRNTDLHAFGVERGICEYGGNGKGASSISHKGTLIAKATLPQRDIYEYLVKPYESYKTTSLNPLNITPPIMTNTPHPDPSNTHKQPEIRSSLTSSHIQSSMSAHLATTLGKTHRTNRINPKLLKNPEKHWGQVVAEQVISAFPDEEVYTCAAGISPSGIVHFGNFRDVMTSFTIAKELQALGKKVRFLFSWDDFDRLRKVPVGVDPSFEKYIGMPLSGVPDPLGGLGSYAERFEQEFEATMKDLGIEMEFIRQSKQYTEGVYDDEIITCLQKRREISQILLDAMSDIGKEKKGINPEEYLENSYPITVYSRFSGNDNTDIIGYDGNSTITYYCKDTGKTDTVNLREHHIAKLGWKIDWAMRWNWEKVNFEPGGADHASPGGSYDTSEKISALLFNRAAPVFAGYQFIGIRGIEGKMSGSKGNALSPGDLLKVYEPALLLWLYLRVPFNKEFELAFDSEIIRQYDEWDRLRERTALGTANFTETRGIQMSARRQEQLEASKKSVPFRKVVGYGQIVHWDFEKLVHILEQEGEEFDRAGLKERMEKARFWLEEYNSDIKITLKTEPFKEYFESCDEENQEMIRSLYVYLLENPNDDLKAMETKIYDIPKRTGLEIPEIQARQKQFFQHIYQLLIGADRGPRLATFLWASERSSMLKILNF